MGVKDLWTILAPVKREKSLTDLAGQRLAVDLSGWVCQAETTKVTILTDTYTIKVLITAPKFRIALGAPIRIFKVPVFISLAVLCAT